MRCEKPVTKIVLSSAYCPARISSRRPATVTGGFCWVWNKQNDFSFLLLLVLIWLIQDTVHLKQVSTYTMLKMLLGCYYCQGNHGWNQVSITSTL